MRGFEKFLVGRFLDGKKIVLKSRFIGVLWARALIPFCKISAAGDCGLVLCFHEYVASVLAGVLAGDF
jgi:hypothetical protein